MGSNIHPVWLSWRLVDVEMRRGVVVGAVVLEVVVSV